MEIIMTPSILKNIVRMPKRRAKQVRARISFMTGEQLERFLEAAKEFGPREHAMFLFAVAHGDLGSFIVLFFIVIFPLWVVAVAVTTSDGAPTLFQMLRREAFKKD